MCVCVPLKQFKFQPGPQVLDSIARHMTEAIAARDKLSKFRNKLDPNDEAVKQRHPCIYMVPQIHRIMLEPVNTRLESM